MKQRWKLLLTVGVGGALLAGCGLRGSLERPPPLIGGTAAEPVTIPEDEPIDDGPRVNEFGGEIPESAPAEPVGEAGIDEPLPAVPTEDDEN